MDFFPHVTVAYFVTPEGKKREGFLYFFIFFTVPAENLKIIHRPFYKPLIGQSCYGNSDVILEKK